MSDVEASYEQKTLYVFLDESGNLDFTERGTDHFVIAAVYTTDPNTSASRMQRLKYDLMASRSDQLEFHATNNSRGTRKRVSETIQGLDGHISVKTMYIDKHYTAPSRQSAPAIMEVFGVAFARWLVNSSAPTDGVDQVVLVFDSVLTGKQRGAFIKAVKPRLKSLQKPFHIVFHPVKSDLNGQIADYFAWSTFRKLEHQDHEPLTGLQPIDPQIFNLFASGHTRYY